jgi:site-specific DNA recombinase
VNSTNGGSKRAVLYCRVSGEEQRKKGYSLADQLDTLRRWCSENGYGVVEEVEDGGYSGAYLERPGLDRVRELVAAGGADAVVVLYRDRIARGVYAQLLAEEFRDHGARLVALNSRGDDSPDGELGDNILDVIAAWERKKIAGRMNRGKRRKAKEGKVVAGPRPNYGFSFNEKPRWLPSRRGEDGPDSAHLPHGGRGGHDAQRNPTHVGKGRYSKSFWPERMESAIPERLH